MHEDSIRKEEAVMLVLSCTGACPRVPWHSQPRGSMRLLREVLESLPFAKSRGLCLFLNLSLFLQSPSLFWRALMFLSQASWLCQ